MHCLATSTRFLAIDKGQVQASLAGRNAGVCGCFALASLHVPMQSTLVDPQDSSHLNTGELVPYLYLSLEGDRPWAGGLRVCLAGVHAVHVGRGTERSVSRKTSGGTTVVRINVADDRMSREHLVVCAMPAQATVPLWARHASIGLLLSMEPSSGLGARFLSFESTESIPPKIKATSTSQASRLWLLGCER